MQKSNYFLANFSVQLLIPSQIRKDNSFSLRSLWQLVSHWPHEVRIIYSRFGWLLNECLSPSSEPANQSARKALFFVLTPSKGNEILGTILLFAILFFAIRQELRLHYSKNLGFATNLKSFSTGFVLVLTNKYESGLKKVPRLCHESGTLWIRNPKRKLCIQKFFFVQTCSCFTKPYSPLSPPDPSSLCLHKIALAMISFPGRLI